MKKYLFFFVAVVLILLFFYNVGIVDSAKSKPIVKDKIPVVKTDSTRELLVQSRKQIITTLGKELNGFYDKNRKVYIFNDTLQITNNSKRDSLLLIPLKEIVNASLETNILTLYSSGKNISLKRYNYKPLKTSQIRFHPSIIEKKEQEIFQEFNNLIRLNNSLRQ